MISACGHRATEPPELTGGVAEPWSAPETSGLYLLIQKQRKSGSSSGQRGRGGGSPAAEAWALESPTHPASLHPASRSHLGQAGEEAGAAGGAAADRGEGIAEDEAVAGQGIQVRGGDGAIVVGSTFKASIVR